MVYLDENNFAVCSDDGYAKILKFIGLKSG